MVLSPGLPASGRGFDGPADWVGSVADVPVGLGLLLAHALRHCLASPAEQDDGRCQAPSLKRGALSRISGTNASSPELLVLQWHRTRRPQRLEIDDTRESQNFVSEMPVDITDGADPQ